MQLKILVAVFLLIMSSCASTSSKYDVVSKKWDYSNPTYYDFDLSLYELRKKTINILSIENQIKNPIPLPFESTFEHSHILDIETSQDGLFYKSVFSVPENQNDIVLNKFGDNFWYSDVYMVQGKKAITKGVFHIHFVDIGNDKTRLSISMIDLAVNNGLECCGPHGSYSRFTAIPPTTIEEYLVISYIGKHLGLNMPKLKVPNG